MRKKVRLLLIGMFCLVTIIGLANRDYFRSYADVVPTDGYYFLYNGNNVANGSEITYSANQLQLRYGASGAIPAGYTVDWQCLDTNILKVETIDNQNVKLVLQGPGYASVDANIKDGSGNLVGIVSCFVKIPLAIDETNLATVPPTINKVLLLDNVGSQKSIGLFYTITPTPSLTWDVVDDSVATVDSTGKVTAVGAGSTTIIVTTNTKSKAGDPMTQTVMVVVKPSAKDPQDSILKNSFTYKLNSTSGYTFETNASYATNLTWKVTDLDGNVISPADKSIISYTVSPISGNIDVISAKAGTYKIMAFANSSFSESTPVQYINITLVVPVKVPQTEIIMNVNDTYNIVDNSNIPFGGVFTYAPVDNVVAKVDATTGVITAGMEGTYNLQLTYNEANNLFATADKPAPINLQITVIDGIALSNTSATIYTAGSIKLQAITTDKTHSITWASDNPSVAKVDKGLVTGLSQGKAKITATQIVNGVIKTASAEIYVQQSVTKITISPDEVELNKGDFKVLKATIEPASLNNVSLHWISSDENIVSISEPGDLTATIQGVNPGTAVITAINQDNVVVGYSHVTVKQHVTGIKLSETSITVPLTTKNIQIRANILPEDATNKTLKWTSTNDTVVKVDNNGLLTIVASGVASIIAVSVDDPTISALCNITVQVPVSKISLDEQTKLMNVGESARLGYLITPETATIKDVTWSSTDSTVASVDSKGLVTAKGAGQTIIVLKTADGSMFTTCTITVRQKATGVTFDTNNLELNVGQSYTIKTKVTPANSTELAMTWESTDTTVATVDKDGKITGVASGKAIIIAKTSYGATIYCNVKVVQQPTGIHLNFEEKTIVKGEKLQIKATILPSNAAGIELTWTSSDTKIAKVSAKGMVTSESGGTAIIKCETKEGTLTKFCIIHVVEPITKIKLNKTSYKLGVGSKYTLKATIESNSATDPTLKWISSNKKIATVNSNGKVTAKAKGYVTITAAAQDGSGAEATCEIRIVTQVTSVSINKSSVTTIVGRSFKLKATVRPANATYRSVNWSSSDENVAIVDSDGVVTALAEGKVSITAKAKDDSGKYDTVYVVVRAQTPATSVTILNQNLTMVAGETTTLQKAINPVGSTDRYTWESDNRTVASVDRSTGRVTAHKPGVANITVMTESGKTATTIVTVVGLNTTYLELEQYSTYTLTVVGVTQGITWDVADSSIAVVTNGLVSSRKVGTTTITATVNGRKISCKLKVVPIR